MTNMKQCQTFARRRYVCHVFFLEKMTPIMEDIFNRKMERREKASKTLMAKYQPQDHKKPRRKGAK